MVNTPSRDDAQAHTGSGFSFPNSVMLCASAISICRIWPFIDRSPSKTTIWSSPRAADHLRGCRGWFAFFPAEFDAVFPAAVSPAYELAFALDDDFDAPSDILAVQFFAHLLLSRQEAVVSRALDLFGNVVLEAVDGDRSRSRRIFEDEAVLEAKFAQELFGRGEIVIGFGWKPDDEIAGDADIGHVLPGAGHEFAVVAAGVAAVHELEDSVAAVLGCRTCR